MPGLVAAAPYERKMDVMRQKREAHAGVIAAARRRGEDRSRLATAATGDVAAASAAAAGEAAAGDSEEGFYEGSGQEWSDDEGAAQRGAAGSGSDEEAAQRRQLGSSSSGRKRKAQFVLEPEPQQG